ncbi:MAG: phosphoribosyltransferase family protein [Actinobacteria bacterium]|nr:phosphoribosyltransferase family protein [Actinomycetota bacterium]
MAMITISRTSFTDFAGRVFGTTCPGCLQVFSSVCKNCLEQISQIESSVSSPKFHSIYSDVRLKIGPEVSRDVSAEIIVAFGYSKVVRQMILSMKYRNMRSSVAVLGAALAQRIVQETVISHQKIDLIAWAPTTARRKSERGHDHAEILARFVAKELKVPCRGVLRRLTDQPQTGRTRQQRLIGPRFISRPINNQCVVVIDDVVTTGTTLRRASQALYEGGAELVICAAVASTVLWQSSIESCELAKARRSRP